MQLKTHRKWNIQKCCSIRTIFDQFVTKLRFRWSFWCACRVKIWIGLIVIIWGHAGSWLTQRLITQICNWDKWPFYEHFWLFCLQLYENCLHNWGSGSHFKVYLSSLNLNWHKVMAQNATKSTNEFFFLQNRKKRKWKSLYFVS